MKTLLSNRKRQWIVLVAAAVIAAVIMEIAGFMINACVVSSASTVSWAAAQGTVHIEPVGYDVSGNRYTQIKDDPQMRVTGVNETVRYVMIQFKVPLLERAKIQVYYRKAGNPYCEADATEMTRIPFGSTWYAVEIPEGQYETIRVDLDGNFYLRDVVAGMEAIAVERRITGSFSIVRMLVMLAAFLSVGAVFLWWLHSPRTRLKLSGFELLLCGACFMFYTLWAIEKPITFSPDEQMRFEVTQFLFDNNRLPKNDELISAPWGFSYAHFPIMLCNQLGYVFMKAASLFMSGEFELLVAARMVSVCAGTCTVYFVTKIAKCVFRTPARFIMIAFVAFMPQFAFLSGYVNNDSLAILGVTMIFYSWVLAYEFKWSWKPAVILALGVSICGLAYYNTYPWIVASVLFFVVSYYYQNRRDHKGFAKLLTFIVVITVALVAYNFIRHLVLYGDLFGFATRRYYGEMYAADYLKPSAKQSAEDLGVTFREVLFEHPYEYVPRVWESFVGVFGYMSVFCPNGLYKGVFLFVCVAAAGLVLRLILDVVHKNRPQALKVFLVVCALVSACVCIGMTAHKHYTGDFQPQGRYHYPAIAFYALLVAKGCEQLLQFIKRREHQYALAAVVSTAFAAVAWYAYTCVFLPA